jgi:hypothetical protein
VRKILEKLFGEEPEVYTCTYGRKPRKRFLEIVLVFDQKYTIFCSKSCMVEKNVTKRFQY